MIKGYMVVVELEDIIHSRDSSYGKDKMGLLRKVSFTREGTPMAVLFRCGSALLGVALDEAIKLGGKVETYV